jgi:hypothetical protein
LLERVDNLSQLTYPHPDYTWDKCANFFGRFSQVRYGHYIYSLCLRGLGKD